MKKAKSLLLFLMPALLVAQTSEYCDSVFIKCCDFNVITPNTITIQAANHSPYLFDYPAFVLMDGNQDTIAKETVNYFGIGNVFQAHHLDIITPPQLPFDGELLLFTGFYDTLWCNFPVYIADTITTNISDYSHSEINIYPNPADKHFVIDFSHSKQTSGYRLELINSKGQLVLRKPVSTGRIVVDGMHTPGLYVVRLIAPTGTSVASKKLIVD